MRRIYLEDFLETGSDYAGLKSLCEDVEANTVIDVLDLQGIMIATTLGTSTEKFQNYLDVFYSGATAYTLEAKTNDAGRHYVDFDRKALCRRIPESVFKSWDAPAIFREIAKNKNTMYLSVDDLYVESPAIYNGKCHEVFYKGAPAGKMGIIDAMMAGESLRRKAEKADYYSLPAYMLSRKISDSKNPLEGDELRAKKLLFMSEREIKRNKYTEVPKALIDNKLILKKYKANISSLKVIAQIEKDLDFQYQLYIEINLDDADANRSYVKIGWGIDTEAFMYVKSQKLSGKVPVSKVVSDILEDIDDIVEDMKKAKRPCPFNEDEVVEKITECIPATTYFPKSVVVFDTDGTLEDFYVSLIKTFTLKGFVSQRALEYTQNCAIKLLEGV